MPTKHIDDDHCRTAGRSLRPLRDPDPATREGGGGSASSDPERHS
jgi:hypothetical protein